MKINFREKTFQKRVLMTVYFFLCISILYNYFFLQIVQNEKFNQKAGNNSIRKIIINAPRGIIYDRNKIPLVDNKPLYDLKLIPHDIKQDFNYLLFDKILNIDSLEIDSIFKSKKGPGSAFKPTIVKRYIDFNLKSILEEYKLDFKGIYFSELPARIYISNCNLTHVLGYLRQIDNDGLNSKLYKSDDIIGYSGIEKYYENYLKGNNGVDFYLVDRFGIVQSKYEDSNSSFPPLEGDSIVLSIDSKLQTFVEKKLKKYSGSIIVMDPENGEVLSLASNPNFDLNSFIGPIPIKEWETLVNNSKKPFTNRTIQETYPPGSIFKLLLGAIALEHNILNTQKKYKCDGIYEFHNTSFRCWKEEGHGEINLNGAIKESCNIYFYNLMQSVDFSLWSKEAEKFGFNKKTLIDLPNEQIGVIPNKQYMNTTYKNKGGWSKGHLLNFSIGQGEVSVTPMQVIQLINLIANDGDVYNPHLNFFRETELISLDYNKNVWKIIKKAMYDAVNSNGGTAYKAKVDDHNVKVFGKTGTAQVCSNCDVEPHAWFAGFIQYNKDKKISICILIENGGKGSNIPAALSKEIFEFILEDA